MFKFDLPNKELSSIIKVIGVGGGGSNAVNFMFQQQIKGVDFIVCNTDHQALNLSPVPTKIQLGSHLTQGLGAGMIPEVGKNAALENIDEIKSILGNNTKMVFITAGMGGGTGTGAAPVIAQVAKEMGILTVGIVTIPFSFEGRKRRQQAEEGLENMRKAVDTLLVINNEKLREMFGNLTLANAFAQADDVLNTAARGIAEMISGTGHINVDFNDVNTVMRDSGVALMGSSLAEGDNRARIAAEMALSSPLLNDNHIHGAKYVLLNITYGNSEVTMDEISEITDFIQEEAGSTADVIWGHGYDESLGNKIAVTIVATGFQTNVDAGVTVKAPERKVVTLEEDKKEQSVQTPVNTTPSEDEPYLKSSELPVSSVEEVQSTNETESDIVSYTLSEEISVSETTVEKHDLYDEEISEITSYTEEETKQQVTIEFDVTSSVSNSPSDESNFQSEEVKEWKEVESPVSETPQENVIRHWLTEEELNGDLPQDTTESSFGPVAETGSVESSTEDISKMSLEEQQKRAQDRLQRIKEVSAKLKTPTGLTDLENEPAYLRRNVNLIKTQHSSESSASKFSVSSEKDQDGKDNTGLRSNNSFLHDNVD